VWIPGSPSPSSEIFHFGISLILSEEVAIVPADGRSALETSSDFLLKSAQIDEVREGHTIACPHCGVLALFTWMTEVTDLSNDEWMTVRTLGISFTR